MYRRRRLLIILFIILMILVVALGVFGFITVRRSFPQTEGVIQLPGLDASVEVYRDSFGIPHIYASTSHDLFMAQGFVHAASGKWSSGDGLVLDAFLRSWVNPPWKATASSAP